jgi:hypothetical protein
LKGIWGINGAQGIDKIGMRVRKVLTDGLSSENLKELESILRDGSTVPLPAQIPGICAMLVEQPIPSYQSSGVTGCKGQ